MLSAAQQDYIEIIYSLEQKHGTGQVRIADIAEALGTRYPTVTRTVNRLTEAGLTVHPSRGKVFLSRRGRRIAREITHRHADLVLFFTKVLGLSKKIAETDTCQIEHGVSSATAQRLHEFLIYFNSLTTKDRGIFRKFTRRAHKDSDQFNYLPRGRTEGWRT